MKSSDDLLYTQKAADEITRLLRSNGADCGWLAHLSQLSDQIQSLEWALLRRSAEPEKASEKAGEPPR